jgi:hypothetical protein
MASLEEAFQKAASLPEDQQEALASILLEEIAAESRWQSSFARSRPQLDQLAREAREEDDQGKSEDLDSLL